MHDTAPPRKIERKAHEAERTQTRNEEAAKREIFARAGKGAEKRIR
jgi:hypothetical protein